MPVNRGVVFEETYGILFLVIKMLKRYKTILNSGEAQISEKKSKFLAVAKPVETEAEARAFIDGIKKKYWDATHNVYAYQIGENCEIQKFSDDGEPSGTAGMPVLNAISDVHNCLIVVTRYFGGTLLGTGGLTRAYGKAAKEALISAGLADVMLYTELKLEADYALLGKVQYEAQKSGWHILSTDYGGQVTFIILVPEEETEGFFKAITEIFSGKESILSKRSVYAADLNGRILPLERA